MTVRPILFSRPMVQALLDGRKTMTRRLAWREYDAIAPDGEEGIQRVPSLWQKVKPGDQLWVRETWALKGERDPMYAADWQLSAVEGLKPWRPSIFMPRWASRITLTVTATKAERLQHISEADAQAEGANPAVAGRDGDGPVKTFRTGFVGLWRSLHGDDAWSLNPEVVALSFNVALSAGNINTGATLCGNE